MGLAVLQFGGAINSDLLIPTPVEEWSASLSAFTSAGYVPATHLAAVTTLVRQWFTRPTTGIHGSVSLDWVKWNAFDVATSKQITDPTNEVTVFPAERGQASGGAFLPISTAYRVSMDDGTRSKRSRGGFFVPRPGISVKTDGRFPSAAMQDAVASAKLLVSSLNGLGASDVTVVIWSRKYDAMTGVSRIRVGDVPDNISRRRNALAEAYSVVSIP